MINKTHMQPNKYLQVVLGLLAIATMVFVSLKARNAWEEYNYVGKAVRDRDTITISGEGKVTATPDLAQISLGVQTDGLTVKQVQTMNTQKMNAIIIAVKALGVADKDIQTSNYSIYPKIDWSTGKQIITGYSVTQNVTVKVRALDSVGDVLAKAGELGANQIGGINFTIDDPKALQSEARVKAIKDARDKAQQLADQIGLTLVKVVTFSESNGYVPPVYPMANKTMDSSAAQSAPSTSIEAGSLDVTSDVSVTFEVR